MKPFVNSPTNAPINGALWIILVPAVSDEMGL